ncbi:beta strand repeat-containing protein, partial [Hymenobacter agri]
MTTFLLPRWALLLVALTGATLKAQAQQCANPGRDGRVTLTTSASPNTYYPSNGAQTVNAGATSISLGMATGATTPIAVGDLLLVIQMQGATIDVSNTSSYGTISSTGYTAGTYEYVTAASAVPLSGGTLTLATGLTNGYVSAVATSSNGQRSFQVVRVPQYSSLTLATNVNATPWNGSSGGLLVLDVANQTNLAGFTLSATAAGFRGGGGRRLFGDGSRNAYFVNDYRTPGSTTSSGADASGAGSTIGGIDTEVPGSNGTKGEGTAGTPRYVNNNGTLLDTRTSYNGLPNGLNDGYPGGDNARGGPADAGGGGTDGSPSNTNATDGSPQINNRNSGGGGGANGGTGGRGGNSWTNNLAIGGEPGAAFAVASPSRIVLGGGGGSGSTNNGTNDANRTGIYSSGGAGGGIVILRTATINSAGGTITANGAGAPSATTANATKVANDGSGGGGAGGAILVTATTATNISSLTLTANGGEGGSNTQGGTVTEHGPGGGGGGGIILTTGSAASATAAAGANGLSKTVAIPAGVAYGSAPGATGVVNTNVSASITNSVAGASCPADVTTTITGPTTLNAGQPTGTFTAIFTNNGTSNASLVTQVVTLPSGATFTTDQLAAITTAYPGTVYSAGANTLTFPTATTLLPGRSDVFTFTFTAPTTATTSASIASNVTTGANEGANAAPNAAAQTLTVVGVANAATTLSTSATSIASGSTVTLTAGFNNVLGNALAASVVGQVQLPVGLTNVTTSGGTYDATTGVVTYNIGTLAAGASATSLTISYTQPATGTVVATASVSTTSNEAGQVSNNQASVSVAPSVTSDVATALSGPTMATAGSEVTFNVTTSNAGTGVNTNVVQTVTLPSGATNVYATGGGVVSTTGGITTVTFPAIAALAA